MKLKLGYKRTEVGIIPEEWGVDSIGKAFEICNHLRLPISQAVRERMNGPYPYYGPTNIQGYINEYRVEGEYALIGEDGDHFLKWREQSMTLLVKGKFNVNNHAHIIRGTKNLTEWFYWYFAHNDITPHLSRQGAGRFKLNKNTLVKTPCAILPLSEQRAIATALSDVDALIASLDRLIAKKRDMKQAAMQELLTGKRRLPGFSGEWEVKRLGEIAQLKNGYAFKSSTYTETGKYRIITIANVQDGFLVTSECALIDEMPADIQSHQKLDVGDFLISMTGNVGRICKVDVLYCLLNQRVGKIITTEVIPEFLFHLVRQRSFLQAMMLKAKGGAQGNLSVTDILEHNFSVIQDTTEQAAIATILSDMDTEIAALEQKRDKTRLLKQGMMQELLTGRIRLV